MEISAGNVRVGAHRRAKDAETASTGALFFCFLLWSNLGRGGRTKNVVQIRALSLSRLSGSPESNISTAFAPHLPRRSSSAAASGPCTVSLRVAPSLRWPTSEARCGNTRARCNWPLCWGLIRRHRGGERSTPPIRSFACSSDEDLTHTIRHSTEAENTLFEARADPLVPWGLWGRSTSPYVMPARCEARAAATNSKSKKEKKETAMRPFLYCCCALVWCSVAAAFALTDAQLDMPVNNDEVIGAVNSNGSRQRPMYMSFASRRVCGSDDCSSSATQGTRRGSAERPHASRATQSASSFGFSGRRPKTPASLCPRRAMMPRPRTFRRSGTPANSSRTATPSAKSAIRAAAPTAGPSRQSLH